MKTAAPSPRRPKPLAMAAALAYVALAGLYIWSSDRLVGASAGGNEELLGWLQTTKGWLFVFATGVGCYALIWRLGDAWWRTAEAAEAQREQAGRLAEANEQLRLLVEGSPHFFFYVQDLGGNVTYVSPTVEAITGHSVQEWLAQTHWFATDSSLNARAREQTRRHLRGDFDGAPIVVEVRHADGHAVLLEAYEYGRYAGERLVGLQGIAHDVTERVRAARLQEALYRISEAANSATGLQDLFASVHAIVGELMPAKNFYIALFNPDTEILSFPYFVDEADPQPEPRKLGRGLTDYVLRTGTSYLSSRENFAELVRSGEVVLIGSPAVDWLGVPLTVYDRTIGVLVVQSYTEGVRFGEREKAILHFVSNQVAQAVERARAEEALLESEERYRRLVEASPDGIVVHRQGRCLYANATAAELLGVASPSELIGRQILDFVHPDFRDQVKARVRQIEGQGTAVPVAEEKLVRADGTTVEAEIVGIPFIFEGEPAVQVVMRDLTSHRRLEEHLRQAQKMEAIGGLAGGVAHDFNNLLQALLSTVQVLKASQPEPAKLAVTVAELEANIKRGGSLTRQLLLFSRREVTRPQPLDLNEVVRDASELLQRLVRENIRMSLELSPRPLIVLADRGQIEQVLVNLVMNASDAMPEGGTLAIRTGSNGGMEAWFAVEDSGVGVAPEIHDRIFEPFFTTKVAGKGTGLGLSVVHGIVAEHRGRIEVTSRIGRGSCFRVVLPSHGDVSDALRAGEERDGDLVRGNGERILLVEDEAGAREGLREMLELLGYEVTAMESGEEAAALPAAPAFEVLLTDLILPGVHGSELAQQLLRRWPRLEVIVMSGYTQDEAIRRGVSEGQVRFLQKPFDMATLARELRAALQEKQR